MSLNTEQSHVFLFGNSRKTYHEVYRHQRGFSLIEVMVSLMVVSFGLLSLTHLQTRSVANSTAAYAETQSMFFLKEMVGHLRIDKKAAINGDYNIVLSIFGDIATGGAAKSFSENKLYNWFNNLNKVIPGVKASINCDITSLCVVEIQQELSGTTQKQTLAVIL